MGRNRNKVLMEKCGKWLTKILNKDVKGKDFQALAIEAGELLSISDTIQNDDLEAFLNRIDDIDLEDAEDVFEKMYSITYRSMLSYFPNPREIMESNSVQYCFEEFNDLNLGLEQWADLHHYVGMIIELRRAIIEVLAAMMLSPEEEPYQITLSKMYTDHDLSEWVDTIIHNSNRVLKNQYFDFKFGKNQAPILSERNIVAYDREKMAFVTPWDILIACMFMKFLDCGGKDYFSICAYSKCCRFMIVSKKGRKKYCDESCRVNDHKGKNPNKI